jgi:predicted RNA-binding protein YlxR (DUF448 family)
MNKYINTAALFHVSRPLRQCHATMSKLPQSLLVRLTLAKDTDEKLFILPKVPSFHRRMLKMSNTTQSSGRGVWVGANRKLLQSFILTTPNGSSNHSRGRINGHTTPIPKIKIAQLLVSAATKRNQIASNLRAQDVVTHPNLIDYIERQILQECHDCYVECSPSMDVFNLLKCAVSIESNENEDEEDDEKENILSVIQKRAELLEMTHLTWKLSETCTIPSQTTIPTADIEMNDPRVGLIVAAQRLHLFNT